MSADQTRLKKPFYRETREFPRHALGGVGGGVHELLIGEQEYTDERQYSLIRVRAGALNSTGSIITIIMLR